MVTRLHRILALFLFARIALAQGPYYYQAKSFGSQALYNPIYLLVNGSYDIIQLDGHSREIFAFPFGTASRNVLKNLGEPFGPISRFGWGNFLRNELFPINWSKTGGQWWPNYQLHLVGGGMTYVAMREWYAYYRFPSPALSSFVTMASYHLLNEFVENEAYVGDNVDPIADLYVFDLGGILLFSFDSINEFFSKTLNLADWSLQPSFSPNRFTLHNNGQYFSVKWKFPFSTQWYLFYYFGMNGLTGLSFKIDECSALSFGAGLREKLVRVVNTTTNQKSGELVWNIGMFYDKENSLMASLFLSGLTDNVVNLNVYPGIVGTGSFSPGLWLIMNRHGNLQV